MPVRYNEISLKFFQKQECQFDEKGQKNHAMGDRRSFGVDSGSRNLVFRSLFSDEIGIRAAQKQSERGP
ncbi:hypothetical protein SDC9_116965 [bioreactor metagenome]|uniref:Uncharacterized protein n=1 Tax=bioreactor metagenome TaxID=1076179 RepID=A0A645BXN7_9ZZZZ